MGKIFAIGDIHGCLENLRKLMDHVLIDRKNDTLVFIGDFIDRGEWSKEVIDYVIGLKNEYRNVVCLLGNHEQMFLRYLEGVDEELYLFNGGRATLQSYGILHFDTAENKKKKIPDEHKRFFESLKPSYETDNYLFAHAGIRPGVAFQDQQLDDLLWIRYEFIYSRVDFGKRVVFGHTPLKSPLIEENKIGIDTGAVYGGKLTCVELPKIIIYQT